MSCLKGEIAMIRLRNLLGILLLSLAAVVVYAQEKGVPSIPCPEGAESGVPCTERGTDEALTQQQKFAIAAEGQEASAAIAHLSGRAPYFIIYDENGNLLEVAVNIYLRQEYGIGPQAAAMLAEKKVTVLVGGVAGPKMKKVLDANNIRFVHRKGVVQQVVDELRQ